MSDNRIENIGTGIPSNVVYQIAEQAEMVRKQEKEEFSDSTCLTCTSCQKSYEQRIICSKAHGSKVINHKILVSISSTVSKMADAIDKSEIQKRKARKEHMRFLRKVLVALLIVVSWLILLDGMNKIDVPIAIFISFFGVIIGDFLAIMHSFVKYMNSLDHYKLYNTTMKKLLDYLLEDKKVDTSHENGEFDEESRF